MARPRTRTYECLEQYKDFGLQLQRLRGRIGQSQWEFAYTIGVDPSMLSRIETAIRPVTREMVARIATHPLLSPSNITHLYHLAGYLDPKEWELIRT